MVTPVYTEFPHFTDSGTTTLQTISTVSGKLHTVVISSQQSNTTQGSITLKDANGTIQVWGTGTAAQTATFDTVYAQPLTVQNTSASDYVTVMAGPT